MRAILTYHSIDRSGSVISVEPEAFRRHIEWMVGHGVGVVDLEQLLQLDGSVNAIALTFDDGFANFAEHAWPVLKEHGLPATLFVATAHAGGTNAWEAGGPLPVLPLLDWTALARLAEEGLALGSHSVTHADLCRIEAAQLADEVVRSAERIDSETGRSPTAFAYPYGSVDDRVAVAVADHYRSAVTTEFAIPGRDTERSRIPRLDAWYFREQGRLEQFGTPGFERFVNLRRGLRRIRRMMLRG